MKSPLLVILIICIAVSLLSWYSQGAINDDIEIKWCKGDRWVYEYISQGINYKIEYEVLGKENVTIEGKKYYVYRVKLQKNNQAIYCLYRVNDLAEVGYFSENVTKIFDPPVRKFEFLKGSQKWWVNTTLIIKMGDSVRKQNISIYYEYLGKKKISIGNKKYTCHVVKEILNSTNYNLIYFSEKIKNIVLMKSFINDTPFVEQSIIESTYMEKENPVHYYLKFIIPLILTICVIMVSSWVIYKKRK